MGKVTRALSETAGAVSAVFQLPSLCRGGTKIWCSAETLTSRKDCAARAGCTQP